MANKKRIRVIVGVVLGLLILVGLCMFVFLRKSGGTLKIDDFNSYYHDVPIKTQDAIFSALYNTVLKNSPSYVPDNGAIIRDSEPYLYTYNVDYTGHYGEFIVDIPEIQQSYFIEFNFNEDPDSFMGGYTSLVYCLSEDKMIYPDFDCKDNLPFVTEEGKESNESR